MGNPQRAYYSGMQAGLPPAQGFRMQQGGGRGQVVPFQNTPPPENVITGLKAQIAQMDNQLANLYAQYEDLAKRGAVAFPEQMRMGVIRYPMLYPKNFVWIAEVREHGKDPFATTAGVASCQFQYNNIYSFLERITFSHRRIARPQESIKPLNTWLPLSCQTHPFIADDEVYVGHDFAFRMMGATEGSQWENDSNWRTSKECDSFKGYKLPAEYQTIPGDTIAVDVNPLVAAEEGEVFEMFAMIHGYKMVSKSEGYNAIT